MVGIKDMGIPKSCSECNFKYYDEDENVLCCALEDGYIPEYEVDEKRLECCPLVETEERKVGKWEYSGSYDVEGMLYCSNCKHKIDVSEGYFNYCPNCGAKMGVEE